jgi:hypothetical protein
MRCGHVEQSCMRSLEVVLAHLIVSIRMILRVTTCPIYRDLQSPEANTAICIALPCRAWQAFLTALAEA